LKIPISDSRKKSWRRSGRKAENALRLDLKQPVSHDYVKQLEERLTQAMERIIKLETLLLRSRDIELRTLTDELREGDEVFKQEPSYEQLKKRKSSKI
jgi:hypothetical protein